MNNLEILKATRDLLKTSYVAGTLAVNDKDHQVHPCDPQACRFCLIGALGKALIDAGQLPKPKELSYLNADFLYQDVEGTSPGQMLLEIADKKHGYRRLWRLNDDEGLDGTLAVIDEAIQKLEQAK